ncbi:Rubrerythrin [Staphylothermus marinus F1]|uniref:Rubrerythrin n=1 Tax=Staphylothermus marinus (strain ATCC 43588 / DSM 3639 / JCM 9404 / F1) TaxID=399550 RepID=A3DKJ6_STAMF|nr:rubrerythrin family protein [Staphylothermus marinus]ABN69156.1 Rubrerythrin [Staphylothermus marinus F1]
MVAPRPMTRDALMSAFGGESMAHMRYSIFADIAEKEGFPNVARLFRAIAFAEKVHARNHYQRLGELDTDAKVVAGAPFGPGNTSKNLSLAIRGEEFEINEMYPTYIKIAESQGETQAVISFKWALEAEKIHAELYKKAKEYVDKGEDMPIDGYIWICPVCGFTYVGKEPPPKCPICGALGEKFVKF